ncbi:MAG: protein translocase subunit SecF, partial [Clostridia bacterium]|nr:protein translocase subunit SecF [Clostridia bacterium]
VSELMGLTSLRTFAIPLSVGLIVGAFSSICLAPTIWVKWKEKQMAKATSAPKGKKR